MRHKGVSQNLKPWYCLHNNSNYFKLIFVVDRYLMKGLFITRRYKTKYPFVT